jgi:hypothetical protein
MKGHPIRGFIAGLLLGIVVDLDLFLGGVVKSDSSALTIVPIVCIIVVFLLGLWAPIGRRTRKKERVKPVAAPLPPPVAWPETAPVEGSSPPSAQAWKAPLVHKPTDPAFPIDSGARPEPPVVAEPLDPPPPT